MTSFVYNNMDFSNENINAVQNHPVLWDTTVNASEEDKELTGKKLPICSE